MRKNQPFVLVLLCLFVLLIALYIKGDLTASVEGLGVKMLIDVKDKRPSPTPAPEAKTSDAKASGER